MMVCAFILENFTVKIKRYLRWKTYRLDAFSKSGSASVLIRVSFHSYGVCLLQASIMHEKTITSVCTRFFTE